ncbi:DUF262 domain-containing protein [Neisseria polysaccharea]|uniref:DUF262 domain-containing protein n=1 Tax=Neisseria polysaccharea TaxID=489 RepID=UPI00272CAF5D|nr:DUF262 domain-containing protein [Neisseria polysaccharea]
MDDKQVSLEQQIEQKRKEIYTDSYPMSIGEIINLYQDGELDIHPEFQRTYRWSITQKSKLIESILLGIPLPSFFVAQRDDGVWDVVDGLQRLSTIFSFLGIYKNEKGELEKPLQLIGTKYLPALENIYWDSSIIPDSTSLFPESSSLTKKLQMAFKREKIDIKIIKKESDSNTKYELFQRLNTFGSSLSSQEVRNCMLIMIDPTVFSWIRALADDQNFRETLTLTDRQLSEEYHTELVLRFLILKNTPNITSSMLEDVGNFLTSEMINMFTPENNSSESFKRFDFVSEKDIFCKTFALLNRALSENSFKRYENGKYLGAFSLSIYEILSIGLSKHLGNYDINNNDDIKKIQEISMLLPTNDTFRETSGSGTRASRRLPQFIELADKLFEK